MRLKTQMLLLNSGVEKRHLVRLSDVNCGPPLGKPRGVHSSNSEKSSLLKTERQFRAKFFNLFEDKCVETRWRAP